MSNDKTLATVKHGGCVQLPTSERERFEAWAENSYHLQRMGDVYRSAITTDAWRAWQAALSAHPSPDGQRDNSDLLAGLRDVEEHLYCAGSNPSHTATVRAAINALSAQPSPGGQGDAPFAWSERAKSDALEAGQYAFTEADGNDLGYTACIEACVDAICLVLEMPEHRVALAARQPVYVQGSDELRARTDGERSAYMEGLEEGKKIAARQPVGELAGYATFRDGRFGSWLFQTRAMAESHDSTAVAGGPANSEIVPLFRSPAQAVDLGGIPEGWRLSKKATCYQLSHGNDIIGNLVGPDAEENAAIIARVLDSQAVGK